MCNCGGGIVSDHCVLGVQGLVAGMNAARRAQGLQPVALPRNSSYIGTLTDDLVTKVRQSKGPFWFLRSSCRSVADQQQCPSDLHFASTRKSSVLRRTGTDSCRKASSRSHGRS